MPKVLAVGDLHIENFGTWRDSEGRLVWGVNDFDETWRLPYTQDLVRLTTSTLIGGMVCEPRGGRGDPERVPGLPGKRRLPVCAG